MEDIFEEIHNEFVNSEDFQFFIKEMMDYEQSQCCDIYNVWEEKSK